MKRRYVFGALLAAGALYGIPMAVMAQPPPSPPVVLYYGAVPGGMPLGQPVASIVVNGTTGTTCGATAVVDGAANNGGGSGKDYAVEVVSESQTPGCGVSGRQIRFYFAPFQGAKGRFATQTSTVPSAYTTTSLNLTAGAELPEIRYIAVVASDKIN